MLALIVRLEYVGIMFQAIDKVYLMHIQGYKMWTTWATNFQIRQSEWKNKHQGNF